MGLQKILIVAGKRAKCIFGTFRDFERNCEIWPKNIEKGYFYMENSFHQISLKISEDGARFYFRLCT